MRSLNRYELLCPIGSGGMGTVFLGRACGVAGFERFVAIKRCHEDLAKDGEFTQRFLDEARLAAKIHHPNVVATLDVASGDSLCLIMEWIEGETLAKLIVESAMTRASGLPIPIALAVILDALAGLHATHQLTDADGAPLGIIHRDVSPQNILVGADGVSRVLDFGIAKGRIGAAEPTRAGLIKGKVGYLAPEAVRHEPLDRSVDIYAAGAVLWEAIAGRRLFRADTNEEAFQMILERTPPVLSSIAEGVPKELDVIVACALEKRPERRFPTADAFARALEALPIARAGAREVAVYVQERCASKIAERQKLMRSAAPGEGEREGEREGMTPIATVFTGAVVEIDLESAAPTELSGLPALIEPERLPPTVLARTPVTATRVSPEMPETGTWGREVTPLETSTRIESLAPMREVDVEPQPHRGPGRARRLALAGALVLAAVAALFWARAFRAEPAPDPAGIEPTQPAAADPGVEEHPAIGSGPVREGPGEAVENVETVENAPAAEIASPPPPLKAKGSERAARPPPKRRHRASRPSTPSEQEFDGRPSLYLPREP